MWSPCLTNDTQAIHGGLGSPGKAEDRNFGFLGGAKLGKKFANVPILQENVKITFIRAKLVTEGVPRVPTL